MSLVGRTWVNAVIGAKVTTIAYLIPGPNVIAPVFGGFVSGYLQGQGASGGMKAGAAKGLVMKIPAIILAVVATSYLTAIPIIGELLAGSIVFLVLLIVVHSISLGLVGGVFGGMIAGNKTPDTERDRASTRAGSPTSNTTKSATSNSGVSDGNAGSSTDADSTPTPTANPPSGGKRTQTAGSGPEPDVAGTAHRCQSCGETVRADARFCPGCGVESPLEPAGEVADQTQSDAKRGSSHSSPRAERTTRTGANAQSTDAVRGGGASAGSGRQAPTTEVAAGQNRSATEARNTGESGVSATENHPVIGVADDITGSQQFDSDVVTQLCTTLANPAADERQLRTALEDAVEKLETAETVTAAVTDANRSRTSQQLESAQRALVTRDDPLADAVEPLFDRLLEAEQTTDGVEEELDRYERKYGRLRDAAETVCQEATRTGAISARSSDVDDRIGGLADAVRNDDVSIEPQGTSLESVVDDVERAARPQTRQSRTLLDTLRDPDDGDVSAVLRSTVETIDDSLELQAAVADIHARDVRRRIDSLDDELRSEDGDVYRHLADRVREFEAILDRGDVDDVRLYAIYQECTFYDRTLLPRLSRSLAPDRTDDVGRLRSDVEARIETIEADYVAVRADHNHTIPRHFLSLATDVCGRARRVENDRPEHAVGLLTAADELLGHVEQLYERNEYSVMLRRLRG